MQRMSIVLLSALAVLLATITQSAHASPTITLTRTIAVTTDAEGGSARPEIVATANRVFVVYLGNITAGGNRTFNAKVFDGGLQNLIASKTIVTTTTEYGSPTDIRLASDGQYLYAFYETNKSTSQTTAVTYLWGAKYSLDDALTRVAYTTTPITSSKPKSQLSDGGEMVDDPAPLIGPSSVYVVTRLKYTLATSGKTIYRVREFTKDTLTKISEFDLDLSSVADGQGRVTSLLHWNNRCAPRIAKRWRVVRGRHGADGRSRRPFSAVKPLWAGGVCRTAGRPRAVQAKPDAARLRRDRGCEGDREVPSHIPRAGARLTIYIALATTVSNEGINDSADDGALADIILVKTRQDWTFNAQTDVKTLSAEPGDRENYVCGLKTDGSKFYLTYKQAVGIPPTGEQRAWIKIFDGEFNLLRAEQVKSTPWGAGGGEIRPSLEVAGNRIFSGQSGGQGIGTGNAEVYVYEITDPMQIYLRVNGVNGVNGSPYAAVTVTNPVTVEYVIRGGAGREFFLVLDAPAMGRPWSYLNATGQWATLPANLADITPFTTAPADGDHTLYTGTVPARAYTLCLGYDTISNGHLNLEVAVYDCVEATVR